AADTEDLSGNTCGNGRNDAFARELLHEQVPRSGIHRVQRRHQGQHLTAQRRPPRLALSPCEWALGWSTGGSPYAIRRPALATAASASLPLRDRDRVPRSGLRPHSAIRRVEAVRACVARAVRLRTSA